MHLIAAMSADGTSITFVPLGPLPRIAYALVQSVGRGIGNEATRVHWAGGDENLTQLPSRTFPAWRLPRRLDAQLDRLTEARGNEVGFRAFPQQFKRSRIDFLDPTAQDNCCLR